MPTPHPRPWHRNSVFGDGPRRPLGREQRARFKFLLNAHARANHLPAKQEKVGWALLKRLGADGRCDPTHDTLAADTGISSRTVRRATDTMADLGLLRWQTRLVRAGWRVEQTSNAYELVPATENPAACCGGQSVRETRSVDKSTDHLPAAAPSAAAIATAQAILAARRRAIEARLLTKGSGTSIRDL
jgi:hypothetical protein